MRLCAYLPTEATLTCVLAVKQGFCRRFAATEAHLSEMTKSGCSRDFLPQSITILLRVGWFTRTCWSVIFWVVFFCFPHAARPFKANSIDDTGDGGLAAAHMACDVFSLLSSSMKRERE